MRAFLVGMAVLISPQVMAEETDIEVAKDGTEEGSGEEKDTGWEISEPYGPTHSVDLDLREGTWMSVSVHGQSLVFDLLGDIWSLPLTGGEATRLTEGPAWDSEPRFSSDGSQIAFVSDADGNEQIWIMSADGTEAEKFSDESEARMTDPVWDPSGDWMIARRRTVDTRSIGVTELYQLHLEGGSGDRRGRRRQRGRQDRVVLLICIY